MYAKRLFLLLLATAVTLSLGTAAVAASSTTATVPVTLTVANEYRAVNVTVPATLPVEVINGVVLTADNACITNNSKNGSVQVTEIAVKDGAYAVGDYKSFSGSETIALKINGCATRDAGKLPITESAFPVIEAEQSQKLTYYAKVSGDAPNAANVQAAQVIFTIAIVA